MRFLNRPLGVLEGWHAHIYYNPEKTKKIASDLRTQIVAGFPNTRMGRWHDEAVGPHLVSMYQVAFSISQFDGFVQWLILNRSGLNILVHPLTENSYNDHLVYGLWLGDKLPLNEKVLRKSRNQK